MSTGGDGTAYMGEATMTPAQKRKDTMLKKKYEKSDDMMKSFKDQYGDKEGEKIFYAKIRKDAMKTEETAIESELVIQDWNVDDIKFTEIETVDIIKAKPLKESKAIIKGLKELGKVVKKKGLFTNLSKNTKIKPLSPKSVATPGTTYATGGRFASGAFDDVSDYAGALPKPIKTNLNYDPAGINLKKGAFKGGGSSKGRIDPDTGDRIPVKDYKKIMKSQGTKNYYEPVKGAKFGDKIMATKRKAFEPLKQEKLPYPKPRKEPKFKVRDDATFGDQIMVRKNKPFSRNFIGRTPMPKPSGKAKYEVGKDGATEFMGGTGTFSKVNRRFVDKKYNLPGLKKPASAPKDASKLYTPKDSYYSTSKKNENILNTVKPDRKTGSSVNPEAGRVLFGKGELKTGVKKKGKTIYKDHYDWREDLGEDWQKVNRKDKTDGLSRKAVKAYRRENPGSKLKTAVTKDPKKLKKGSKDAKRRLSFCRRMKGMKKRLTSAKTARDPDSRINKALRRWNC